MKSKQIFKVFFILVICVISLSDISGSQEKIIKVGVYDNAPIVFADKNGKYHGLSVEILEYIAEKENWQLEYVPGSWSECINRLDNREIDVQVYIAFSKKRALKYDYNQEALLTNWGVVYTWPGSGIDSILDLEGKQVALLKKAIHPPAFRQLIKSFGIHVQEIEIDNHNTGFKLVSEKKADAVVVNRIFGLSNAERYDIEKTNIIFNPIEIRYACPKGKNADLLAAIDRHLKELKSDKTSLFYQSFNKAFGLEASFVSVPVWIYWSLAAAILIMIMLLVFNRVLKIRVKAKTKELENEIRERINIEQELKKSEERFDLAMRFANDGLFDWNLETNQIYYSPVWKKMLGYKEDEIQNEFSEWERLTRPEDVKACWKMLNEVIERKRDCFHMEFPMMHKQGHWVDILSRANIVFDEMGKAIRVVGTHVDITERKKVMDELKYQKELLQAIIDNIPVLITLYDPKANMLLVNKAFENTIGWNNNEINEIDLMKECYPDPEYRAKAWAYMQKASTEWAEFTINTKHGQQVDSIWSNVHMEDGTQIGIGIDITEKKKMEIYLQQKIKMEAIATLAGGIAHDFNNMLGVIFGNVSYVLSEVEQDVELYEVLSDIQEGAKQAQKLTQQLLTFSKGGMPVKEASDLNDLIKESALFLSRGAKSGCRFDLAERLWTAEVDKGQIHQVISNLVINANQAMPEGGTISIATENIELEADNNFGLSKGRYIKITIEDQGTGIPKKHLINIFDPFFTTKQKGSGLGLSTAYSIIKKHGGHITVYSELDKGSVFHIYLPASFKEVNIDREKKDIFHQGKGRILVMDDQEQILTMIGRLLNRMGYECSFATDGNQAIEMYKNAFQSQNPFDLVILDLTVPGGMGGALAMPELLKINPEVKAVVSSGYSNDPIMANYQDYGFCGVMPKPFSKDQMSELLEKIFKNKERTQ